MKGDDPTRWHADLPGHEQIVYRDLWPGDLAVRGRGGELKYEFRVRPGARVEEQFFDHSSAHTGVRVNLTRLILVRDGQATQCSGRSSTDGAVASG